MSAFRTNGTTSTSGARASGSQDGCSISTKIVRPKTLLEHVFHLSPLKGTSRTPDRATCQLEDSAPLLLMPLRQWEESCSQSPLTLECCIMDTKSASQSQSQRENFRRLPFTMETWPALFPSTLLLQVLLRSQLVSLLPQLWLLSSESINTNFTLNKFK